MPKLKNRVSKICSSCEQFSSCSRPSDMQKKCYQSWYNRTQRDKQAEKLRQALYRQTSFANSMLARCKSLAQKTGLDFDLDLDWFKKNLKGMKCAASGLDFVMPVYEPNARGKRGPWTPSVDRIDNSKGYVKENCRLVVWMYNLAKSNYKENEMYKLCNAVIKYKTSKNNGINIQAKQIAYVPPSLSTGMRLPENLR